MKEGDIDLRCPNARSCPAQVRGRVEHIGSRGALDVEALGEVTAAALTQPTTPPEPPLVTEAGLFALTLEQLVPIEVVVRDAETGLPREDEDGLVKTRAPFRRNPTAAEKKSGLQGPQPSSQALTLLAELEKAKTKDLWRLLVALNIRHVGPVVGLPSDHSGEEVVAAIVVDPGADVDVEAIREYARSILTPYKVPRRVFVVDELPKSLIGKVLRRQVKEKLLALTSGV